MFRVIYRGLPAPASDSFAECLTVVDGVLQIKALPLTVKLILLIVFIPWVTIPCVLWWLGCRWLVATNNFENMILNAIALEFVLLLKELAFKAFMPHRSMVDLCKTVIKLDREEASAAHLDIYEANRSIIIFVITAFIVFLYIGLPPPIAQNGLQQVLSDYKWDVYEICEPWLQWKYSSGNAAFDSDSTAYQMIYTARRGQHGGGKR